MLYGYTCRYASWCFTIVHALIGINVPCNIYEAKMGLGVCGAKGDISSAGHEPEQPTGNLPEAE